MALMTHTLTSRAEPPRNRDVDLPLDGDTEPLRESDPGLAAERGPAAESAGDGRDGNNVDAPGEIDPSVGFIGLPPVERSSSCRTVHSASLCRPAHFYGPVCAKSLNVRSYRR